MADELSRLREAMASDVALHAYLNRLVQYVGPTAAMAADPEHRSARVAAKKYGRRDDELAAIDTVELGPAFALHLKHLLVLTGRYETALERFPNLRTLELVETTGEPVPGCLHCAAR